MPDRSWLANALEQYERPLVRYARRLTGNLETARDIVQDCFLRLCQQPPRKVEGRLKPWLFLVCRNRAIDHLRKEGRMDALDQDLETPETPDEQAAQRETRSEMRRCIDALPARQREVLHLKFQDGLARRSTTTRSSSARTPDRARSPPRAPSSSSASGTSSPRATGARSWRSSSTMRAAISRREKAKAVPVK